MRISDWSSDVCSSDLQECLFFTESPTKKAPRVRSRWGVLCNETEKARRPGLPQSYRALTSSGSYPGWPSTLGLRRPMLGSRAGTRHTFLSRTERQAERSEEHTSELQSLMRTSYAVFCLKKKK